LPCSSLRPPHAIHANSNAAALRPAGEHRRRSAIAAPTPPPCVIRLTSLSRESARPVVSATRIAARTRRGSEARTRNACARHAAGGRAPNSGTLPESGEKRRLATSS
jgi:hypothetical protein